jgi:hypothetical protein
VLWAHWGRLTPLSRDFLYLLLLHSCGPVVNSNLCVFQSEGKKESTWAHCEVPWRTNEDFRILVWNFFPSTDTIPPTRFHHSLKSRSGVRSLIKRIQCSEMKGRERGYIFSVKFLSGPFCTGVAGNNTLLV